MRRNQTEIEATKQSISDLEAKVEKSEKRIDEWQGIIDDINSSAGEPDDEDWEINNHYDEAIKDERIYMHELEKKIESLYNRLNRLEAGQKVN